MKIHIKNGRLIDPANRVDGQQDVFIAAGRIVGVGAAPEGFAANRIIDATGRWRHQPRLSAGYRPGSR
jgi:dihydroorotase